MRPSLQAQLQSQLFNWLNRRTTPAAVRRVGEMPIGVGSDIGYTRKQNQDRLAVLKVSSRESFVVLALCDGMGGMIEGAVCASQAIASFFVSCIKNKHLPAFNILLDATHAANRVVHALYKGRGGTTLSAVLVDNSGRIFCVNVGDSRIYSFAGSRLEQLTTDDTMAGLHPNLLNAAKNELLQFVGIGEAIEPHIFDIPMTSEQLLLTTDGVHYLDQSVMKAIVQNAGEPAVAVRRLIEVGKWCGGRDNLSAVVVAPQPLLKQLSNDSDSIQICDPYGDYQFFISESEFITPRIEDIKIVPIAHPKALIKKRGSKTSKKQKVVGKPLSLIDETKLEDPKKIEEPKQELLIYLNGDREKS